VPTPPSRNPFAVLRRHREYRIFWTGQTASLVGTWMQAMAQGWLALQLSNSALVVGLVAAMNALPMLLFSFHAGALVDRGDRLAIVTWAQRIFLLEATTLFLLTWSGLITVPLLLVLAAVHGACATVEIPARQSFVYELVGREDLQPAIALNSSGFNLARVIGPAIGGVVIANLGIAACFGLNAVSYGFVLFGLRTISAGRATIERAVTVRESFEWRARTVMLSVRDAITSSNASALDGLRYLLRPGLVRDLLGVVTVGAIFGGPIITLMPVFARERLGLGAGGYGSLLSALGVGGVIGALLLAGPLAQAKRGRLITVAAIAYPALLLTLALSDVTWLALVILPLVGVMLILFNSLANSMLQLLVADEYRGRLMALYGLIVIGLSQSVGALTAGAAARAFGVQWAVGGGAVVVLVYAAITLRRRPEIRRA
jgi:MFS family permease